MQKQIEEEEKKTEFGTNGGNEKEPSGENHFLQECIYSRISFRVDFVCARNQPSENLRKRKTSHQNFQK